MFENDYKESLPDRRSIRLKGYDYSSCGGYFVTICCKDGAHRFGSIVNVGAGRVPARNDLVPARNDSVHTYVNECIDEWCVSYNEFGRIVIDELQQMEQRFTGIMVPGYMVMPNHVHFMLIITDDGQNSLSEIVRRFKMGVSNRCMKLCKDRGVWMEPLWQRNYYERIIRDKEEYDNTLKYMYENPTRWGATH